MDKQMFLTQELEMLKSKKNSDLQWLDINNFRREQLGIEETVDTTRKGFKLLAEFLDNGWELKPLRDPSVGKVILTISDLHYPFQLPVETWDEWAGKVDVLVLNGDLLDCTSISKYPKVGRSNQIDEMIGLRTYLINLVGRLSPKKVIATNGNHEMRLSSYISTMLQGGELQELIPNTLLSYVFNDGFYHYDKNNGTKVWYEPLRTLWDVQGIELDYTDNWWAMEGDIMFCHPKAYSSAPLKTAMKAVEFFHCIDLPQKMRVMCMSHTHRVGRYRTGSVDVYEQGCCCNTKKLVYNDGMLINPQKEGYIVFYQDRKGQTIARLTDQIILN